MLMSTFPSSQLVRDRFNEQLPAGQTTLTTRQLGEREFIKALRTKLQEEVRLYLTHPRIETLAEIQELVMTLASAGGDSEALLEQMRQELAEKQGRYTEQWSAEAHEVPVAEPRPLNELVGEEGPGFKRPQVPSTSPSVEPAATEAEVEEVEIENSTSEIERLAPETEDAKVLSTEHDNSEKARNLLS